MKSLGAILLQLGFLSKEELKQGLKVQKAKGGALGKILIQLGHITEEELMQALAVQMGMEVVELSELDIPDEVLEMVPFNIVETYKVVPYAYEDDTLYVATSDPTNIQVLDDLRMMLNCRIQGAVASKSQIEEALRRYYGIGDEGEGDVDALLAGIEDDEEEGEYLERGETGKIDLDPAAAANSPPVVKYLNLILKQGIKEHASDIHLEPFEKEFKIRMRIDGVLYEMAPPPPHLASAIVSRIKVMSKLDIAETRLPQDGRIELTIGGRPVDLRVSTLPTLHGESVVMRILDRTNVNLDLEKVGLRPAELEVMRALIEKPNGIIFVTGPTGSGKTTTLYSALSEANRPEVKIITTEDPVEYDIEGLVQVQVNPDIGVTYASCLRAILRQDPDKILVGEIRDLETAQIAVEASLTGHLVLSTLHTNDAPSAVARLVDLGVEPFLIAATLEAVIAQRLVRKICTNCRTAYEPSNEELYELGLKRDEVYGKHFYYGKGCKVCNNAGYKGRQAIFEIMLASEKIRQLITDRAPTSKIKAAAKENGMRTLRESGLIAIYDGHTTIEEVVRETVFN